MKELMFEWRKYFGNELEMSFDMLLRTNDFPSYLQEAPESFS